MENNEIVSMYKLRLQTKNVLINFRKIMYINRKICCLACIKV